MLNTEKIENYGIKKKENNLHLILIKQISTRINSAESMVDRERTIPCTIHCRRSKIVIRCSIIVLPRVSRDARFQSLLSSVRRRKRNARELWNCKKSDRDREKWERGRYRRERGKWYRARACVCVCVRRTKGKSGKDERRGRKRGGERTNHFYGL